MIKFTSKDMKQDKKYCSTIRCKLKKNLIVFMLLDVISFNTYILIEVKPFFSVLSFIMCLKAEDGCLISQRV